ncbi:MAG TPA: PilZ domain-containing protein [Terriglobia bacterium]|nr:PilZ domain-containing protein [Terriglobia bacterium]
MTETGRRRTDRILAPVRIRVIGNDASGVSFAEETVTISFNQQGARISLTHSLLPDDVVLIKNLDNDIEEEFRVVGGLQQVFGDRREWGVEATNTGSEIWGVEFSQPAEGLQPKVLIECAACKRPAQAMLSSIEYDVLLSTGLISRHCERCAETTRWKPSVQPLTAELLATSTTATPGVDKRKTRRLKLTMRIRVRNTWGVTDVAQTRDVSKTGLCFVSTQRFQVGDDIFVTLPFADLQTPVETPARIVWLADGNVGRFYGASYIKKQPERAATTPA